MLRCSFEENKQINLNDDHSDESLKCSDEIATSKSTKIHNGIDIKEYLRSKTGAKLVEQDLINEMSILGVKGYDTVDQYFSRKSKPFEGTSDENLLRMCGTITEVNVTRQRSNSICAVFTASFDIEHDEKEWFYKLKIMCDEKYELHVINDLRLQMKYETLKSETQQKEYRTFRAKTECQSKKSIEEFEMIYKQMKTPQFRLENCIQTERNLLCRFMLARITPSILIVDSLKIAMDNQLPCISMAISWYLVRHYVAQSQVKNLLGMTVDIWPGYFCKCLDKGHSSICSKEPVIVVEAERHLDALPDEYLGIQVLQSVSFRGSQLMEAHNTDETEYISNITSHSRTIQPLPCNIVENLFLKHSKLTMTYISSEMPEYVQLCCQVKGIIPIGEDHFPAEVFNLKTYVSEGHVLFLQNIFVGQRISKEASFSSYGTLGGFVKYRGKPAALTCAHVFYDRETLLGGSKRDKHETEVDTFCRLENDTVVACGYVVHDAFEYDTRDKTSVDAAVVRLNTDILVDENAFFKDKTSTANPVSHLGKAVLVFNYIFNSLTFILQLI